MPQIRIGEPVKRRAWIKDPRPSNIKHALESRLAVIRARLWQKCPPDLFPYFCGMLVGVYPLVQGLLYLWATALEQEDEKQGEQLILQSLQAITTISYLNHVGRIEPKIVYFSPPWLVKTEQIHILDLKPPELIRLLDKALAAHGADKRSDLVSQMTSDFLNSPLPDNSPGYVSPEMRVYEERVKNLFTQSLLMRDFVKHPELGKPDDKEASELVGEALSNPRFRYLLEHEKEITAKIEKNMPDVVRQESEIRMSISHTDKDLAISSLGNSKLSSKAECATGSLKKRLKAIYAHELKHYAYCGKIKTGKKASPDLVYSVCHEIYKPIKDMKKHSKKHQCYEIAFLNYKKQHPSTTRADYQTVATSSSRLHTIALGLTAHKLNLGLTYCEQLYKQGAKTAAINKIWFQCFEPVLQEMEKLKAKIKK